MKPSMVEKSLRPNAGARARRLVTAVLLGALLQACGGGGEETPSAPVQNNAPPTISGTPSTNARAGQAYAFTPTASDPEGTTLAFSVQNRPSWAAFNTSTGRLSGTPAAANVGTFANVAIRVSDGVNTTALPTFTITVSDTATGAATLTWTPPTQRTDGSALTNLAGYRVYYGNASASYGNNVTLSNPGLASYVVEGLNPGSTYYFVVTAFDSSGTESSYSLETSKTIS